MIQRIQTIWLLLASTCSFLTLKLSFYSGNKLINNQKEFLHVTASENILLTILSVAVGITSLVLIFLYKDRKMQLRITLVALLVSIGVIALYFSAINNYIEGRIDLTSIFVFAIPVFILMAARGIYKDEKLVKSVDRLR